MIKSFAKFAAGLALCGGFAFSASYTYSTSGCFSSPAITMGTGAASFTCGPTGSTLTLSSAATEVITFTDQPTAMQSSGGVFDLGMLAVNVTGNQPSPAEVGANFSLAVTFIQPAGTTGDPFTGFLSGNEFGTVGGVTLSFSPQTVVFSDGNPADMFSLTLVTNPVQASTINSPVEITATVGPAVPEPATLGFLGTGLLIFGTRRWFSGRLNRYDGARAVINISFM